MITLASNSFKILQACLSSKTITLLCRPDQPTTSKGAFFDSAPWLDLCIRLFADPKFLNYGTILGNILLLQVLQKPSSLPDQFQQTSPGVMIFLVYLEVLGQVIDPVT